MIKNIITNKERIEALESIFGESKLASAGTNIAVVCPSCKKDSKKSSNKKKLSIDLDTGMYHCWVCESKGKFIGYFARKHFGNKQKEIFKIKEIYGISEEKEARDEKEEAKVFLPHDFELISTNNSYKTKIARKFLKSRGLSEEDILSSKAGISGEIYNRIIFPSFDENMELNYYLTRDYSGRAKIPYVNCKIQRKNIIFNEYLIDWTQKVILVEGLFDSIKAGANSVPVLGSWIDEEHAIFQKIIKEKSEVVLGFDPDARKKTIELAKLFSSYGVNAYVCNHTKSDFGDMTKQECKFYIDNAKLYEQTDRMTYLIQTISGSI